MKPRSVPAADRSALAGAVAGISFIAGVGGANARAEGSYPRPWATPTEVADYFTANPTSAAVSATGQLTSAVSLAVFTRSIARLAARTGDGRARTAAIAGGTFATGALAASAACTAALSGHFGHDPETAARLHHNGFQIGGPIHGIGYGLLCAGAGAAALHAPQVPRPAAIAALFAAVPNVLSPLYWLARPFGWLIPAGRFPGLVALGVIGARLARPRLGSHDHDHPQI